MGESISPIFFCSLLKRVKDQAKKHKRGVQAGYESMYSTHRMEV